MCREVHFTPSRSLPCLGGGGAGGYGMDVHPTPRSPEIPRRSVSADDRFWTGQPSQWPRAPCFEMLLRLFGQAVQRQSRRAMPARALKVWKSAGGGFCKGLWGRSGLDRSRCAIAQSSSAAKVAERDAWREGSPSRTRPASRGWHPAAPHLREQHSVGFHADSRMPPDVSTGRLVVRRCPCRRPYPVHSL